MVFRPQRFLVTGGLGFIGSNFIKFMLRKYKETRITNVDNLSHGSNPKNLKELRNDHRYDFVRGSITDQRLVSRLLSDMDVVINFAAESHVDRSISNAKPFVESNILGVYSILEAMRRSGNGVELIHVSTDEEYGEIAKGSFKESDRLEPSSPYAASKAASSMLIKSFHRTYGLNTIITRCTNNFGPYQFPEKLIPKTIIRALSNLKIPIYGSGRQIRDWLYVTDHCEALDLITRKGEPGNVYNIASGTEVSNIDLVRTILEIVEKPLNLIEHVEDRPGHDRRYSLDARKVRVKLGWTPRHSFLDALRTTVSWYLENEWWWRPLADRHTLHRTPWRVKW